MTTAALIDALRPPAEKTSHRPPRVFVTHQPTGRDRETGAVQPSVDLTSATDYGPLEVVLGSQHNPLDNPAATLEVIRTVLRSRGYGAGDYLLLVGSPVIIGLLCAAATEISPQLRLLQWNRGRREYAVVSVDMR